MRIALMSQQKSGASAKHYVTYRNPVVSALLQAFGAVSLILFVAVAVFAGTAVYSGRQLDSESKDFADSSLQMIASDWDEQALLDRASPAFLQVSSPDRLKSAFATFSALGHMTAYQGSKGDSNISIINWSSTITARYTATAQFQNGTAQLRIALVKQGGQWMINAINVTATSPVTPPATRAL